MTTTFADHLRALPDEALAAVLQLRPDLVVPVPADLSALAVRAQSRVSVARVLDGLDEYTLQILDAARLTRDQQQGTTSTEAIVAAATAGSGPGPAPAWAAVNRLRAHFLLYGPESALRVVAGADEACSPYPAGLGRPAAELDTEAAALCAEAARLRRTLLAAPPAARAVLDRLAAGPPVGTVPTGALDGPPPTAGTPAAVRWLVDQHLLVPISEPDAPGTGAVELPREVGLLLRRDHGPLGRLRPQPPAPAAPTRDPKLVDSAGAGQTMEAVRHTEALLESLAAEPAPVLRSGGLGVRDLRRLARATGLDESTTGLLLEVAYAAGLAGELELTKTGATRGGALDQQVLPTTGYELWRTSSLARRWAHLARAWLAMPRQVGLIGERDERDRPVSALSAEVQRAGAPAARRAVLGVLAGLPLGAAPTQDELLDLLAWHTPRRSRGREAAHREALAEASRLGFTGLGALTSYGRLLLTEPAQAGESDGFGGDVGADPAREASDPVRALGALLPDPVDHFLVQADLSVVVPGPPEPLLAAELDAVAQPESAGGASVHRVTEASLRRALDIGYTADDLHAIFKDRSRTPVPQSLTYLIDDVARRHGGLRAGPAGAYLRSDDEALLAQLLTDRRLTGISLRRLAPTVLITAQQPGRLISALREAGYAPVPEDTAGVAILGRAKVRRAPAKLSAAVGRIAAPLATPRLSQPRLLGIVEQIRRGDAAARAARRAPELVRSTGRSGSPQGPSQEHTEALAVLQQALRDRTLVWVGYVDAHGATVSRLVRPTSIGGGYLRAEDERTEMLHTFALHRITAAVPDE